MELKEVFDREKEIFIKEFYDLDISRCIGNLAAEEYGVIPGPEIIESDLRANKGKFIVMGTESLWKFLTEDEVGEIVSKHFTSTNSDAACKELQELAKERWKNNIGGYDDISVIVIFIVIIFVFFIIFKLVFIFNFFLVQKMRYAKSLTRTIWK